MPLPVQVEYEGQRIKVRDRNKKIYRISHWPIWIWVFFLAPARSPSISSRTASAAATSPGSSAS
jgi:hypothetical protein